MKGKARGIGLFLIATVIVAVYALGLKNELVFDDFLLNDPSFRPAYGEGLSLKQRFISYGSFFWSEALIGAGWWKQRIINLLLHLGTTFALLGFYRALLSSIRSAQAASSEVDGRKNDALLLLAVGFFTLNPVAVYAVAYLVQRSILMATLGVVVGLWCFTVALNSGRKLYFLAAALAYLVALGSKEHALLAPLCAIPVYIFVRRPSAKAIAIAALVVLAMAVIAGTALFTIYGRIIGTAFDEFSVAFLKQLDALSPGVGERAWPLSILNQMHLFTQYGLRWLFPIPEWLSIDLRPPFPLGFLSVPHIFGALAYLAILGGGSWLLLAKRDEKSLIGLALLLPALLFGTEFATVWVQDPFVLYRSYLWAIGIPGLIIALFHGVKPKFLLLAGSILAVFLAVGAVNRVYSLATPISAWGDAIDKLSGDSRAVGRWRPYLNRGEAYLEKGMTDAALRDFDAADASGDMGYGLFNRGVTLYLKQRKHAAAIEAFNRAEQKGYTDSDLPYQRGLARIALLQVREAYSDFDNAIKRNLAPPMYWIAMMHRGMIGAEIGDPALAVRDLEQAIPNVDDARAARVALGLAHVRAGDAVQARTILSDALPQTPSPAAFYARALALHTLKQKAEALADIDAALRLAPNNPRFEELRAKIRALP